MRGMKTACMRTSFPYLRPPDLTSRLLAHTSWAKTPVALHVRRLWRVLQKYLRILT